MNLYFSGRTHTMETYIHGLITYNFISGITLNYWNSATLEEKISLIVDTHHHGKKYFGLNAPTPTREQLKRYVKTWCEKKNLGSSYVSYT